MAEKPAANASARLRFVDADAISVYLFLSGDRARGRRGAIWYLSGLAQPASPVRGAASPEA
ncbi:hypothetical protein GCM10022282_18540 [Agromyces indicus]